MSVQCPALCAAILLTEHINKTACMLADYLETSQAQPGASLEADADEAAG